MCVYILLLIVQKYGALSNATRMLPNDSVLQSLEEVLVYLDTEFLAKLSPGQELGRQ